MTCVYNGQFDGNILVVGRTNCGKTTFIEKLGLNNYFGDITKTEWISGIDKEKLKYNLILVMVLKFILRKNRTNLIL